MRIHGKSAKNKEIVLKNWKTSCKRCHNRLLNVPGSFKYLLPTFNKRSSYHIVLQKTKTQYLSTVLKIRAIKFNFKGPFTNEKNLNGKRMQNE